ncbi:hypothetical protein [Candidatus Chloroploca asiatica]|nr:hypothetical protein [Candidatus Chloroploca asiatica]
MILITPGTAQTIQQSGVQVPTNLIAESLDYATHLFGNPWDMDQYGDISHYLNESGQRRLIRDPQVSNGVFRGSSYSDAISGDGNAAFFPLFPGYIRESASDLLVLPINDLVGANAPIPSNLRCLYVALRSESPAANRLGPDVMRIFWFADRYLNRPEGAFGMTYMQLYPEAFANLPTPRWQVIQVDLANPPNGVTVGEAWTSRGQWQGLRIDPTAIAANVGFEVDWIRLTDCTPSEHTITWAPDAAVQALWLRPVGTTRDIRLTPVNGINGRASVDLQGVPPGRYQVGVGTLTTCCSQRSDQALQINQTPIGTFAVPSPASGNDYATLAGNAWDFRPGDGDATVIHFQLESPPPTATYDGDGMLLVTPSGPLPAGIDVAIKLNTPLPLDPNVYRYLTIDMETSWLVPWSNIPHGMIGRWIWSIQGTSGRPGFRCTIVGPDIPYDIGRQQIMIDLWDPESGMAEEWQGECPTGPLNWRTAPILELRFDPNENITEVADRITGGGPFTQRIRSIRLTNSNTVAAGTPYKVIMSLNKAPAAVQATFYYTTDRANPRQNLAARVGGGAVPLPDPTKSQVFLPVLSRPSTSSPPIPVENQLDFTWDTTGVNRGTYYLCADLFDATNGSVQCSLVPVIVQ